MNGELKQVPSNLIYTDKYQRPVEMKRVLKIIQKFNPAIVNPIKVSYRDSRFWVFDGQHTLAALKTINNGEDLLVPCRVYENLTYEDEANLFAQQFGDSKDVEIQYRLNALNEAKDVDVLNMCSLVNSLGFAFDFTRKQGAKKIIASATLWKIYQKSSQKQFVDILESVRDIWKFNPDSLKKEILGGMYFFFSVYDGEFDIKKAKVQFSKVPANEILRDGNICARGGDKRYARVLVRIYNKGLRNRLDEYKLDI